MPRADLTQLIAGWLYQLHGPPDGVVFGSRHDDNLQMWAVFEQPGEGETGTRALSAEQGIQLTEDSPELLEALRIFGLSWA